MRYDFVDCVLLEADQLYKISSLRVLLESAQVAIARLVDGQ